MGKNRLIPRLQPEERKLAKLREEKRRTPKNPESPDGFALPIGWNFNKIHQGAPEEWRCTFKKLSKYRKRLLDFEGKSFKEIEAEPGSSHAWEDTTRLDKRFQKLIEELNLDKEALWQLELDGKARLFGVRHHNIFKLIWLDLNHKAYKVAKKHT